MWNCFWQSISGYYRIEPDRASMNAICWDVGGHGIARGKLWIHCLSHAFFGTNISETAQHHTCTSRPT